MSAATWMRLAARDDFGDWLHVPDAPCTLAEARALGLDIITRRDPWTDQAVMLALIPERGLPLDMEAAHAA